MHNFNIDFSVEAIRDLSTGQSFKGKDIVDCSIISLEESKINMQMSKKLAVQGNRYHIDIQVSQSKFNKIEFSCKAKVLGVTGSDEGEDHICVKLEMSQYNQSEWEEIKKLILQRQENVIKLFNTLKGVE